ncbi:hypothetical protein PIB30_018523 [Stylosanthes scabra]|uniref:Uncharacterized protein n=1 Tax=Stylosanthes scabra TaxID=79078 RepID=A0ABU6Y8C2_9FABA|nr:hypothetical protein [Stylosanthes scabra]
MASKFLAFRNVEIDDRDEDALARRPESATRIERSYSIRLLRQRGGEIDKENGIWPRDRNSTLMSLSTCEGLRHRNHESMVCQSSGLRLWWHRQKPKLVTKFLKRRHRESLGEDISNLFRGRYMNDFDLFLHYSFSDEINVELKVFCSLVQDGVVGKVYSRQVVAEHCRRAWTWLTELLKQVLDPLDLCKSRGKGSIFSFGRASADGMLLRALLGYKICTVEDTITDGGAPVIKITGPIRV